MNSWGRIATLYLWEFSLGWIPWESDAGIGNAGVVGGGRWRDGGEEEGRKLTSLKKSKKTTKSRWGSSRS